MKKLFAGFASVLLVVSILGTTLTSAAPPNKPHPTPKPKPTPTAVVPTPTPTAVPTPTPTPSPTPSPTPTATPMPTPTPTPISSTGLIFFGAFEDQNVSNEPSEWQALLTDIKVHGLDSVATTNGFVQFHEPLLTISDQMNIPVITSQMMGELTDQWYPTSVPATLTEARRVIGPLADKLSRHPSVVGYNIRDDATTNYNEKMRLVVEVIKEYTSKPASPMLVSGTGGNDVYNYVKPGAFLYYNYPANESNTPCSWATSWPNEIRASIAQKPNSIPLWLVLQVHSTNFGPIGTKLRVPTAAEVRLQTWIGLGENAKGIWWFIYSSQQGWIGLKDSPLYSEVTSLASRVTAIEGVLGTLNKVPNIYIGNGYISTMSDGSNQYLIVANTSCNTGSVTLSGPAASFRNIETGQVWTTGQAIPLIGGNGVVLKIE